MISETFASRMPIQNADRNKLLINLPGKPRTQKKERTKERNLSRGQVQVVQMVDSTTHMDKLPPPG